MAHLTVNRPALSLTVAHKGYLISFNAMTDQWRVSKDNHHISYATSYADARATVDMLTEGSR
jgi:hypothetical protein